MHYVVDSSNQIVDVDDSWDDVASSAQAGPGALRLSVIGRQLEACIAGDATKMFVRAALDSARLLQQKRTLPYRCDTVGEHRRFEMVISPLAGGHVKVEHRLVKATPKASPTLPRPRRAQFGWRCSQCLQVRLSGAEAWAETELAPQALLAQDVCPACASRLFGADNPSTRGADEPAGRP